jgi:hypothetical protein
MVPRVLQRRSMMEVIASSFQPHMAMARGVLILDENVLFLQTLLERKNFKVYTVPRGAMDEQIAPLLAHRVLVTNNIGDFFEVAAIHEFSIIDTSNARQDPITLAAEISEA